MSQRHPIATVTLWNWSGMDRIGLGNVTNSDTAWNQYEECAAKPKETSLYSIEIIKSTGLVGSNACDRNVRALPHPGEMVIFVKRLSWWERVKGFAARIPD